MLSDFFKPAWKSNSVEKRQQAISDMDISNPEKQQILAQLANDDKDNSVRIAAIRKITSAAFLHEMSLKKSLDSVSIEAEKRLGELLGESGSVKNDEYRDLLQRHPELKLRIAAHAELSSVRTQSLNNLSTDQLIKLLGISTYSDTRQLSAEKLTAIDDLESARKVVRGKDKNAERILKAKIDEYRQQQRQHAENIAIVEKLIEEVEFLASHDWMPEFKAKLLLHRDQWDKLAFDIEADSNQRYKKSRQIIDSRYEQRLLIEQTQKSQQQLMLELESMINEVSCTSLSQFSESLSEILTKQQQFSSDWQQLAIKTRPHLMLQEQYEKLLNAFQSASQLVLQSAEILTTETVSETDESELSRQARESKQLADNIKKLTASLKNLKWPADLAKLQVAIELQQKLADWRDMQQATAVERQQKLDGLHKKINSIFHFSRIGNLARAKQFCDRVEKGLGQFDGKDRQALDERLEEARKKLGNMGDWKNFATEPKYVELCEAMEQLVNSKKHPDKISSDMKDLQKQWKVLGHSDISDQYWVRFKEAADKVYQPCAEFFDERHKTRQTHLQQRQQYVEQMRQLSQLTDWDDNPDYKEAQSSLKKISDHFSSIKDVERNAGQKQWKQFSKLKDEVFVKLDIAYQANIKLKQELIKQTEVLATADARQENLSKLKILQTRWKQVGITKRNQDQKAWTEFKKQGDIVYHKVQQLRQHQRDESDQQLNAYRNIIKEIKQLASTAKKLTEADQQFIVLQAKYDDLPELDEALPEKLRDAIQRDYNRACDLFDECHRRIINSKHSQQIDALRLRANLCVEQEAFGESPSTQQLEGISEQWDAIDLQDSVLNKRIQERRNSAQHAINRDEIGAERRILCIQLEIAKGVESPIEDKSIRMQYQLQQMNESGLGQHAVNSTEQLENMELEWLFMPGAEMQLQKELDERFYRVLGSK